MADFLLQNDEYNVVGFFIREAQDSAKFRRTIIMTGSSRLLTLSKIWNQFART